MGTTNPYI